MTGTTTHTVFVSQRFPPDKGGNAARMHDITVNLDQEVTVLAPPPSYPPGEFDRSWQRTETDTVEGVTVHRLWSYQPQAENPGMGKRMAYYLIFGLHAMAWLLWHRNEYDVVVTTTPPISTGAAGLLAKILGKPWIVDVRDLWIDASISLGYLDEGSVIERISRQFQKTVLHAADRISITTPSLGESLQETYGSSLAEKMIEIPNGVDTDRFQPTYDRDAVPTSGDSPATPQQAPSVDTKMDGGRPTIIYTGNLGSSQTLDCFVEAMDHLSHDSAVLRLVGSGDVESQLREQAADLGVQDSVDFEGLVPREEVPSLLTEATIGIAPIRDTEEMAYAMPTKLYEYMASGLPTVVTGRGEIEQFVEQSGGGVHTDTDPESIAATLDELLSDRELRHRLGLNGREYTVEHYDRKAIARRLGEEIEILADGDQPA